MKAGAVSSVQRRGDESGLPNGEKGALMFRLASDEIELDIETIEQNAALYAEANFDSRVEAIDHIEFHLIERVEGLLRTTHSTHSPEKLLALKRHAQSIKRQLEAVDDALFQRLRADIRMGAALKDLIDDYVGRDAKGRRPHDAVGYDTLDLFINGLLLIQAIPTETKTREPEMVYYQQTPARIILDLVEKAHLTPGDVFFDLGSGLGHVPILVNLLSGAAARGIEFEPAYCDYASRCAADLNLSRVTFIQADARSADYCEGTIFFMYTPFTGRMLQDVLEKLQGESRRRRIRLLTYGPCTLDVSRQSWLMSEEQHEDHLYKLGVFSSL